MSKHSHKLFRGRNLQDLILYHSNTGTCSHVLVFCRNLAFTYLQCRIALRTPHTLTGSQITNLPIFLKFTLFDMSTGINKSVGVHLIILFQKNVQRYFNSSAFFKKRQGHFNCYFLVFNIDSYFVKPNLKQCILFVKKIPFQCIILIKLATNLLSYSRTTATFWILFWIYINS